MPGSLCVRGSGTMLLPLWYTWLAHPPDGQSRRRWAERAGWYEEMRQFVIVHGEQKCGLVARGLGSRLSRPTTGAIGGTAAGALDASCVSMPKLPLKHVADSQRALPTSSAKRRQWGTDFGQRKPSPPQVCRRLSWRAKIAALGRRWACPADLPGSVLLQRAVGRTRSTACGGAFFLGQTNGSKGGGSRGPYQ